MYGDDRGMTSGTHQWIARRTQCQENSYGAVPGGTEEGQGEYQLKMDGLKKKSSVKNTMVGERGEKPLKSERI